jgi:hypothetical protein
MVRIEEKAHKAETGFISSVIKPTIMTMDPITKEVDPELMNDQIVAMETRIAAEEKIQKDIKEVTKLEKEIPLVEYQCNQKKEEFKALNKSVISLKELIAKFEKNFKQGKADVTEYKKQVFETEQKIKTLESKKAQVEILTKQLELKKDEATIKLEKIKSDVQKKVEKNGEEEQKKIRTEAIEICQKKISEKELKLVKVEKLVETANSLKKKINRETSEVVRKVLEAEVKKVLEQIKKGETKIEKLTKEISQGKKIIREATNDLKTYKKEHEKEKLKDLVKGECTAYTVRPHRRYCTKRLTCGACANWSNIYRTEKCLVWKGDKCVQNDYNYSKNNSRYECASRNHEYKVNRCTKFDTTGKCIEHKTFYGIKKCLSYETNNGKIVCVKDKVLFPEYACKTKVGDVCTDVTYHRVRFYCKSYKLNADGHRFCHHLDVFYGENNYEFECLKEGKHNGKDAGCLEYKKVLVPGAEKLVKIGKTWLKENCKALKVTKVNEIKGEKKTEVQENKKAIESKKDMIKDVEAEKVIEQCKKQIKQKLAVIREANKEKIARTETVVKAIEKKTADKPTSKVTESIKEIVAKKVAQVKKAEEKIIKAIKTEEAAAKKSDKIIKEQAKLAAKDPKAFKSAVEEIKKQAEIKRACNKKITEIAAKNLKKLSEGVKKTEAKRELSCKFKTISKEKEAIFEAEKEISKNKALIKKMDAGKVTVVVNKKGEAVAVTKSLTGCQRKIELQKVIIAEAKKTIAETKKDISTLNKKIVSALGEKEGKVMVMKMIRKEAKAAEIISKCNKKIISMAAEVETEKAKIEKEVGVKKFDKIATVCEKRQAIHRQMEKKWKSESSKSVIGHEAKSI